MPGFVFLVLALSLVMGTAAQVLLKSAADSLPRARAMSLQFFCASLLALAYASVSGNLRLEPNLLLVFGLGFVASLGAYAQWEAVAVSLSRTSLVSPLSGAVTAVLAVAFLREGGLFKNAFLLGVGVAALVVASSLLGRKTGNGKGVGSRWTAAVVSMVLVFGAVQFGMKWSATEDIPRAAFLSYWYLGAFLGSLALARLRRGESGVLFASPHLWKVPLLGLLVLGALAAQYRAYELAPASFVAPVLTFGQVALPVLAGLWGFGERQGMSRSHLAGFLLGSSGVMILIASRS